MTNLIQTAIEQNWTIGEFKKRIAEQSSLKDNCVLDNRGDESASRANMLNNPQGSITNRKHNSPFIDADSLDLNKLIREV